MRSYRVKDLHLKRVGQKRPPVDVWEPRGHYLWENQWVNRRFEQLNPDGVMN